MKQYSKIAGTCTTVDPGCPCVGAPAIEPELPCPLNFYWATRITGTTGSENGKSIAVGVCGNVYVTGIFTSTTITIDSYQSSTGSGNPIITQPFTSLAKGAAESAYVVKYDVTGQAQWAARLAGPDPQSTVLSYSLAIDSDENVYVTGGYGPDPVTIYSSNGNSFANLPATSGGYNVFVVKYNSAGIAQWATTISGTNFEYGNGIAVDSSANVYVTGYYDSNPITVNNSNGVSGGNIQVSPFGTLPMVGLNNMFIVKYSTSGIADWATYLGGPFHHDGFSVATDNNGYVYVTGQYFTDSVPANVVTFYDFVSAPLAATPIATNPYGTFSGTSTYDAFVVKYKTSGTGKGTVQWATNLQGSPGDDRGLGIAVDTNANVYVTGAFNSAQLTIKSYDINAPPPAGGIIPVTSYGTLANTGVGTYDVFLIKFATDGTALWATSVGGLSNEGFVTDSLRAASVAADSNANVYLTGFYRTANAIIQSYDTTQSPPSGGAISLSPYGTLANAGKADVFIVKYSTNGVVQWATHVGGTNDDGQQGADIAVDPNGNVHVISDYTYVLSVPPNTITFFNFTSAPNPIGSAIGVSPYGTIANTGTVDNTSDVFIVKYNTNGQIV